MFLFPVNAANLIESLTHGYYQSIKTLRERKVVLSSAATPLGADPARESQTDQGVHSTAQHSCFCTGHQRETCKDVLLQSFQHGIYLNEGKVRSAQQFISMVKDILVHIMSDLINLLREILMKMCKHLDHEARSE